MAPQALTRRRWEVCSKSVRTERRSARDGSGSRRFVNSFFCIFERGESSSSAAAAVEATTCWSVDDAVGVPPLPAFFLFSFSTLFSTVLAAAALPLDFRRDERGGLLVVGIFSLLLLLSSRLSRGLGLILTEGEIGDVLSLLPFLRERCFILEGLMTGSLVIGEPPEVLIELVMVALTLGTYHVLCQASEKRLAKVGIKLPYILGETSNLARNDLARDTPVLIAKYLEAE